MPVKKGTVSQDRRILTKWFGDLKVIEAKTGIRIQPNETDIKNAIRGDPMNCVFSKACQRMWSSTAVVFFGTIAYVDLLDKKGVRHVERFTISSAGQRFIKQVDAAKTKAQMKKLVRELKSFWLNPPSVSRTAEQSTESSKKSQRKIKRAILLGKTIVKGALRPKRKPSVLRLTTFFRNGKGMAQFPKEVA